jgi:parallel beta-helix repeat protein
MHLDGEDLLIKNHFVILVLVLLLAGMVAFVNHVQKVEAVSPTVTINADGSISPPTAPITNTDNVTYKLTDNITTTAYNIFVNRDNIILDGAGYTLQSEGRWNLISLGNRNNVTVMNFNMEWSGDGIQMGNTSWITIKNCNFTSNGRAVLATSTTSNFTFTNNYVSGRYRTASQGPSFGEVYDGLISGNTLQYCAYGIVLYGGENVTVKDNLITDCTFGMWPLGGTNISIFNNTISNNGIGICKTGGSYMTLRIYHNYFINNNEPATAEGGNCTWDNGYPSGGTYWSGYVSPDLFSGEYQNITGGDGIGDNPFKIYRTTSVWDYYPRMFVSVCNVSQSPPKGSVFSTDAVRVNATITHVNLLEQVILNCTYSNSSTTWTTSINMTNLGDDIWNGIIPSLPVGTNVTYTIIAQDTAGNSINSKSQGYTFDYPVVIPEFPTYALLPILFTATLFAALAHRRKRIK